MRLLILFGFIYLVVAIPGCALIELSEACDEPDILRRYLLSGIELSMKLDDLLQTVSQSDDPAEELAEVMTWAAIAQQEGWMAVLMGVDEATEEELVQIWREESRGPALEQYLEANGLAEEYAELMFLFALCYAPVNSDE